MRGHFVRGVLIAGLFALPAQSGLHAAISDNVGGGQRGAEPPASGSAMSGASPTTGTAGASSSTSGTARAASQSSDTAPGRTTRGTGIETDSATADPRGNRKAKRAPRAEKN